MSGYRDATNLRLEFTTDYDPIQAARTEDPTFVILPIKDVVSANPFDPDEYVRFFGRRQIDRSCPGVYRSSR